MDHRQLCQQCSETEFRVRQRVVLVPYCSFENHRRATDSSTTHFISIYATRNDLSRNRERSFSAGGTLKTFFVAVNKSSKNPSLTKQQEHQQKSNPYRHFLRQDELPIQKRYEQEDVPQLKKKHNSTTKTAATTSRE